MKKRKYIAHLLLMIFVASCQNLDKNDNKRSAQHKVSYEARQAKPNESQLINDSLLIGVLKSQLADGKEIGGEEYESHQYTEKDLKATSLLVLEILAKNGYRFPDHKEFAEKVENIFHRALDTSFAEKQVYINFIDPCNKAQIYSRIEIIANGVFVEKGNGFITDLYAIPELIDYQSRFPELKDTEDSRIIKKEPDLGNSIEIPHWKDVNGLAEQRERNIQKIVARNMYLFNGSRTHFQWLCLNDKLFLKNLVMVFGYTKDEELLKWVLNITPAEKSDASEFGKLLFYKTCEGKLVFHRKMLEVIAKDKKAEEIFSFLNDDYITYLFDSTDSGVKNLTDKEKEEITAAIQSFTRNIKGT